MAGIEVVAVPEATKSHLKTAAVVFALLAFAGLAWTVYKHERDWRQRMKFLREKYGPGLSTEEMLVRDAQGR